MAEYKNQHYIPQFYLRCFSQDRTTLYRYSLAEKKSERKTVEKTCAALNFYAKGPLAALFEGRFSRLESEHAKVIQKIVDARSYKHLTPPELSDRIRNYH